MVPEKAIQQKTGGYGLKAVKERLRLAYPQKHALICQAGDSYSVNLEIETDESDNRG